MEYFVPYTRLRPTPTSGMQLTNVRANVQPNATQDPTVDAHLATVNAMSGKKIKKFVQNEQFKQLNVAEMDFPPTKMSKKQLKMAQDQLKKLTKINIHLSGKFGEAGQSVG